jgi:hypothetical protein
MENSGRGASDFEGQRFAERQRKAFRRRSAVIDKGPAQAALAVAPHARRRIDGTGNGFTVAAGRSFDLLLREGVVFCLLARLRLLLAPGCDPF